MGSAGGKRASAAIRLVAIAAQLALASLYVGLVVLTVPGPEFVAFWTAVLVPVVWLGAFIVLWLAGEAFPGVSMVHDR